MRFEWVVSCTTRITLVQKQRPVSSCIFAFRLRFITRDWLECCFSRESKEKQHGSVVVVVVVESFVLGGVISSGVEDYLE